MATVAYQEGRASYPGEDLRFGIKLAAAMALTAVAGFSLHYLMGRSSFSAPLRVHLHAAAYFGWIALFVTQSWLGSSGRREMHRRLGWFSLAWMGFMIVMGCWVMTATVRAGTAPFFFRPQMFLIQNPGTIAVFIGLTSAAITLRRRTDWHVRLHVCGLAAIMGPAFGRLLPMPLLIPYAFEAAAGAGLIFPLAGALRDLRKEGRVHPAWWTGMAVIVLALLALNLLAHSPAGGAIYRAVTDGTPGASVAPLEFAPPPGAPRIAST